MNKSTLGAIVGLSLGLTGQSANALTILDAWQLHALGSSNTNIGELSLSGGLASVEQEVDGSGNPFAGARFTEFGEIFSISFVSENCAGACDSGFPQNFSPTSNGPNLGLRFRFEDLAGTINSFNAGTGEISFIFDAGVGDVFLEGTDDNGGSWQELATFDIADPSGGSLSNFFGPAGTNGDTTLTTLALTSINGLFRDSLGNFLDSFIDNGTLFFLARTNNEISTPAGEVVACSFDAEADCRTVDVGSNGSANLAVPEPGSLALLSGGLLLFPYFSSRFKKV
ncbi:MAG: hypothetical protein ACPW60_11305 [Methylohalobius sp. ZOD2]